MNPKAVYYHPILWRFLRSAPEHSDLCSDFRGYKEEIYHDRMTEEQAGVEMSNTDYGVPGLGFDDINDFFADQEEILFDVSGFEEAGSNIFHLRPGLVEMFKNTSAEEIPVDAVKLPFESVYLYWGKEAGIITPDGNAVVNGAYIKQSPDVYGFFITLTTQLPDIQALMETPLLNRLMADKFRATVLVSDNPISIGEMHRSKFKSHLLDGGEEEYFRHEKALIDSGFHEPDHIIRPYKEEIDSYRPNPDDVLWRDQDMKASNIIFNFLCYMSYEKRDVNFRYPKEAPDKLVVKAENVRKPTEARRAQSKLESLGFRKVYVCGDNVQKRYGSQVQGALSASHWRRGHWRNQACGEKLSKHKLIWIEPTLVKPGQSEPLGHVYNVKG